MPESLRRLMPSALPLNSRPSFSTTVNVRPGVPETWPAVSTRPSLETITPLPEPPPARSATVASIALGSICCTLAWMASRSFTFSGAFFCQAFVSAAPAAGASKVAAKPKAALMGMVLRNDILTTIYPTLAPLAMPFGAGTWDETKKLLASFSKTVFINPSSHGQRFLAVACGLQKQIRNPRNHEKIITIRR